MLIFMYRIGGGAESELIEGPTDLSFRSFGRASWLRTQHSRVNSDSSEANSSSDISSAGMVSMVLVDWAVLKLEPFLLAVGTCHFANVAILPYLWHASHGTMNVITAERYS